MKPRWSPLLLLAVTAPAACDLGIARVSDLPPLPLSPTPALDEWSFASLALPDAFFSRSCGATLAGAAACWSFDLFASEPVTLAAVPGNVSSVAVGARHTCALTTAGAAFCWGDNWAGQLGDETRTNRPSPTPVAGGLGFTRLEASGVGTCGITDGGAVYCWGNAGLGSGEPECPACTRQDTVPILVAGAEAGGFSDLTMSPDHACILRADGVAFCWGANYAGQTGTGLPERVGAPVSVDFEGTFSDLAAGQDHTCGLDAAGAAHCWGLGFDDPYEARPFPTAVPSPLRFASIHTGPGAACALDSAGAAFCWGSNHSGRLGTGSIADAAAPEPVSGGIAFSTIDLSATYACGLELGSGRLLCWGEFAEP